MATGGTGCVHVIFGPMFSGKTTELLRRVRRYTFANEKCLIIKYERDKRYCAHMMATHDHQTWEAVSTMTLGSVVHGVEGQHPAHSAVETADVIGIDEGQFFPDLAEVCDELANAGKVVIVAALDSNFKREPFAPTRDLLAISETVTKLSAVCMGCYKDAAFSKRLGDEVEEEVIGGAEEYASVCRACYFDDAALRANLTARNP